MLDAVFRGHSSFMVFTCLVTLLVSAAAYAAARRRDAERPVLVALYAGSVAVVPLLTLWSTGGSQGMPRCVVDLDLVEPFRETEGLFNVALFLPVGLFGVLALRRLPVAAAVGVLLTCAIETTQGLFPALGRACDTSDVVTNSAGVLAGCAAGAVWLLARGRFREVLTVPRRVLCGVGAGYLAVGACAFTWITPDSVAHTSGVLPPTATQRLVAVRDMHAMLGDQYTVVHVQLSQSTTDTGTVVIGLSDGGWFELRWPDRRHMDAQLDPLPGRRSAGLAVPGWSGPVRNAAGARRVATAYLRGHAPWAFAGATVTVQPREANGLREWAFTWTRPGGVRAGIVVNSGGRLEDIAYDLPAHR